MKHPHAISTWKTIRLNRNAVGTEMMEVVFVIETDLELDGTSPKYDQGAADDLFIAAQEHMAVNSSIDRVEIVPIGTKRK